ncbi:ankyrin repeat domain-containing protein [Flaviaesturariibacter flavus]|uniref:Ankyrin repeat domain-containing protein n=1 Tax=Flaviaesturariibacter flavus TaxID=2502780 RepID=A0A4R1BMA8_9BACT|nr:ankyrin repeat domain-containing protein [Flaviaesturariibacter flavus]
MLDNVNAKAPIYPSFSAFLEAMKTAVAEGARRPLVRAARAGNLRRIELLLRRGQDINEQDLEGNTPLMAALLAWQYPAAEQLLQQGPDLARTDRNGHTALMWACYRDQPRLVEAMLALGADPKARTAHGDSVLLFALTGPNTGSGTGSPGAVRLLLAAGVDPAAPVDATGRSAFELAAAEGSGARDALPEKHG